MPYPIYLVLLLTYSVSIISVPGNIEMCVTGRSRSLKIVPFKSFGMFFYSHSIATTALSCIISEIKQ